MSTHAAHPDTSDTRDDQAVIAAHDPDRLLHALTVLDFNPAALAEQLDVSPFALADWLASDDTQRQLARYQAIERQMLDLRALKSRRITIESLEHVLETTQDLVEKRRTATTLLRLLDNRSCPRDRPPVPAGPQRGERANGASDTSGRLSASNHEALTSANHAVPSSDRSERDGDDVLHDAGDVTRTDDALYRPLASAPTEVVHDTRRIPQGRHVGVSARSVWPDRESREAADGESRKASSSAAAIDREPRRGKTTQPAPNLAAPTPHQRE